MEPFPPELIGRIISFLDAPTLLTASLISRTWLTFSRPLYFDNLGFHVTPKSIAQLRPLIEHGTTLPGRLSHIVIDDSPDDEDSDMEDDQAALAALSDAKFQTFDDNLKVFLTHFNQIHSITISHLDLTKLSKTTVDLFLGDDITLKIVIIQHLAFSHPTQVLSLVTKSIALDFLGIGTLIRKDDSLTTFPAVAQKTLQRLDSVVVFTSAQNAWDIILHPLLSQPCSRTIKMAVLLAPGASVLPAIQALVTASAENLEQLAIGYLSNPFGLLDLSQSQALRRLSFDLSSSPRCPSHFEHFAQTVLSLPPSPQCKLEHIVVNCGPETIEQPDVSLTRLDSFLAASITTLKAVIFTIFVESSMGMFAMGGPFGNPMFSNMFDKWRVEAQKWGEEKLPLCNDKKLIDSSQHFGSWTTKPFGNLV